LNTIKRYQHLYDEAVKEYVKSCNESNSKLKRANLHSWKQRMKWLDQMLSEVETHFAVEEV